MPDRLRRLFRPEDLSRETRLALDGALAMVSVGVQVVLLWIGGFVLLQLLGVTSGIGGFIVLYSLFFAPGALLTAFLVGFVLWRYAPRRRIPNAVA